jgi:hypothetical protein
MLLGFFDDSGKESDPSNRIVCAAGYLASGSNIWGAFHEIWKNSLLRHGIDCLHMKEVMCEQSKKEPFVNWDWPKKKEVLEEFSSAIKMSHLVGFGVAVDADAWREVPRELTKIEGTAQEFCFMRLIRMVVDRMKRVCPEEHLQITFDCDKGFTPSRFQRFIALRERLKEQDILSSFCISEPRHFMPLQAADFLAWESRTQLLRIINGNSPRPEFEHLLTVLPGYFPDYTGEVWDRNAIEQQIKPMPLRLV